MVTRIDSKILANLQSLQYPPKSSKPEANPSEMSHVTTIAANIPARTIHFLLPVT
jgi:hypothetical protein